MRPGRPSGRIEIAVLQLTGGRQRANNPKNDSLHPCCMLLPASSLLALKPCWLCSNHGCSPATAGSGQFVNCPYNDSQHPCSQLPARAPRVAHSLLPASLDIARNLPYNPY